MARRYRPAPLHSPQSSQNWQSCQKTQPDRGGTRTKGESFHEKLIAAEFVSFDGVMQAPGGVDEDTEGGFTHGGWT